MSGWALVWYWVIVIAIFSYFTLAIVLAIGGFFDVKTMFRRLAAVALKGDSPPPEPPAPPSADCEAPQDPSRHEADREIDS